MSAMQQPDAALDARQIRWSLRFLLGKPTIMTKGRIVSGLA